MEDLKYPIGRFKAPVDSIGERLNAIEVIEQFPHLLKKLISNLSDDQLNAPYRPEGWTILQLIHHCADSHMNALCRFKLALSEEHPVIKPYLEAEWAKMADYGLDVQLPLEMISFIHIKWVTILLNMSEDDFRRSYFHPEQQKSTTLSEALYLYAWHCEHHYQHILKKAKSEQWIA